MQENNNLDLDVATIKINDTIYYDPSSNCVIIIFDRITLTMTLSEYSNFIIDLKESLGILQNLLSTTVSLDKVLNSYSNLYNYTKKG